MLCDEGVEVGLAAAIEKIEVVVVAALAIMIRKWVHKNKVVHGHRDPVVAQEEWESGLSRK